MLNIRFPFLYIGKEAEPPSLINHIFFFRKMRSIFFEIGGGCQRCCQVLRKELNIKRSFPPFSYPLRSSTDFFFLNAVVT